MSASVSAVSSWSSTSGTFMFWRSGHRSGVLYISENSNQRAPAGACGFSRQSLRRNHAVVAFMFRAIGPFVGEFAQTDEAIHCGCSLPTRIETQEHMFRRPIAHALKPRHPFFGVSLQLRPDNTSRSPLQPRNGFAGLIGRSLGVSAALGASPSPSTACVHYRTNRFDG